MRKDVVTRTNGRWTTGQRDYTIYVGETREGLKPMLREFVEVKTFKYDYKGRVVKKTKHVVESVNDMDEVQQQQVQEKNPIGFRPAEDQVDECEEDEE